MFKKKVSGIIIQARTGSTRLPRKIILPFYNGRNILELLLERFKREVKEELLIVATSTNVNDDAINDICEHQGVFCFRGDESDVLQRFIGASIEYGLTDVVRVCADNPFFDVAETMRLLNVLQQGGHDYVGFAIEEGCPSIKSHLGLWGEAVSLEALRKVSMLSSEPIYHEHVTNYMYSHSHQFNIKLIRAPYNLFGRTDFRFTLDTVEDFDLLKELYNSLITKYGLHFTIDQLIGITENNPTVREMMKEQIEKNKK